MERGEEVFEEPLLSDVRAVACETMRRVRHNIELLVPRLHQLGYQFGAVPDDPDYWKNRPVLVPPPPDTREAVKEVEDLVGTIPLSLRAWYEIVGGVNLIGLHSEWPETQELDPLYVDPLCASVSGCTTLELIRSSYEDWKIDVEGFGVTEVGEFEIAMAPDFHHKVNVSGGPPYSFAPSHKAADVLLLHEWYETTFVNYLRICLRWGGFPGIKRCKNDVYKVNFLGHLPFLTQDFRPF
ncbi:MAG TPA: hypothetical protein VM821_05550 [Abditibacteriaceae bacterium]|nr:hypothetical protein [Abditibacteriaceae bacterium]